MTLKIADHLGRGRGRLRLLDDLRPPVAAPLVPELSNWSNHDLAAIWIGHATVLLRINGKTVLTDPVFSSRIGIGLGLCTAGPKRLIAPALKMGDLPPIDLILISHAHFDHLDRPTLVRLKKSTPVVTSLQTQDLVRDLGFRNVRELRWHETMRLNDLSLTARPVLHWGARTFHDRHRGYNAYVIDSGNRRVFYGGDTAYTDDFGDIAPVDLAIFGIGAYDPFVQAHATPEQAWSMANHLRADFILPMHHSTFRLSYEPTTEPIERLREAAGLDQDRIAIQHVGATWVRAA